MTIKYNVIVQKEEKWYVAKCLDNNIASQGKTIEDALENLREAFEFALISEGTLKSDRMYDKANVLKVRLDTLIKSEYSEYFKMDRYIDKTTFII